MPFTMVSEHLLITLELKTVWTVHHNSIKAQGHRMHYCTPIELTLQCHVDFRSVVQKGWLLTDRSRLSCRVLNESPVRIVYQDLFEPVFQVGSSICCADLHSAVCRLDMISCILADCTPSQMLTITTGTVHIKLLLKLTVGAANTP